MCRACKSVMQFVIPRFIGTPIFGSTALVSTYLELFEVGSMGLLRGQSAQFRFDVEPNSNHLLRFDLIPQIGDIFEV